MACCLLGAMIFAQWLATWERVRALWHRLLGRNTPAESLRMPAVEQASIFDFLRSRWMRKLILMEVFAIGLLLWREQDALTTHMHHLPQLVQSWSTSEPAPIDANQSAMCTAHFTIR